MGGGDWWTHSHTTIFWVILYTGMKQSGFPPEVVVEWLSCVA